LCSDYNAVKKRRCSQGHASAIARARTGAYDRAKHGGSRTQEQRRADE